MVLTILSERVIGIQEVAIADGRAKEIDDNLVDSGIKQLCVT